MGIFAVLIYVFLAFIVDHKVKLRYKYQNFSERFSRYYIDFIALLVVNGIIFALVFLLSLIPLPDFLIDNLSLFLVVYSLFVILPIKFLDEIIMKIYKE